MKEIEITPVQQQEYLKHPNHCPFCGSSDISAGNSEFADDVAVQDVECHTCKTQWTEQFKMTGIIDAMIPDDEPDHEFDGSMKPNFKPDIFERADDAYQRKKEKQEKG